ncbi:MAG: hypothetical protein RLZZ28_1238, partial [Bacteroidota bacterium]
MKGSFHLALFLVLITGALQAATVDTIGIYSKSMHREIKTVVVKPANYQEKDKKFPVVYLLHG